MPDLITLAIPAFIILLIAEAVAGAVMQRDIFEFKDAAASITMGLGNEFSYYWFHRVSHECRFFWASHVVHHSSQRYNFSTALHQTWTGSFTSFVFWLWLPIIGFAPVMIMTMKAISLL